MIEDSYKPAPINLTSIYAPAILRLSNFSDKQAFDQLIKRKKVSYVHDEIHGQLQELIKCENPSIKIPQQDYEAYINSHLKGRNIKEYGVWVYYPWNSTIIHLLDEEEFVKVRTNRNQYKITKEEQEILNTKKIGIVGLSVGQSIALTMAMERTCGELRLADFDTAELSNLNRLRTGLHNLGLKKTIIAAREIAEIDPFLKVKIFNDGLTKDNLDDFFLSGGSLDLFVEVCDGLDIKIESRYKARQLKIPVVMDTNDRGMLDVERFDLEPERPILHGLADGLNPDNIKGLTNEEKIPFILKMIGAETLSTRLKASMLEVEQSINTWPQLASSVTLGGALTTDVCRRILLDQYHDSGRYYIDFEELVKDKTEEKVKTFPADYLGPPELCEDKMIQLIKDCKRGKRGIELEKETITEIVKAGILAPSGGNAQPWKFLYTDNQLYVFHDPHFSHSLLDFNSLGSYVAIGAAIENIFIKAAVSGFEILIDYFPLKDNKILVAVITFTKAENVIVDKNLEKGIGIRVTNREIDSRQNLPDTVYEHLKLSINSYQNCELHIIDEESQMENLGKILAKTEMLRIVHPRGHYDTFKNELRWTEEEIKKTADGLDVNTLGASKSEIAALKIAADEDAISFLRSIKEGNAFTKMVNKSVASASAIGIITMPEYSEVNFLKGGRALERLWIEANLMEVSFQPIAQLVFMLARLKYGGNSEGMGEFFENEFKKLKKEFHLILPALMGQPVFIFRLCKAHAVKTRSLRRPVETSFTYLN